MRKILHTIALIVGLGLALYWAFSLHPHTPDRYLDNNILTGCYQNGVRSAVILSGRTLKIEGGDSAKIGPLSQIKQSEYVYLNWIKENNIVNKRYKEYAGVEVISGTVYSMTLLTVPSGHIIFRRVGCK